MPPHRIECVILIGLQGSGKTALFRERFAATHEHVSKDALVKVKDRAGRQMALLDGALAAGRSVVVDSTNASKAERAPVIARARQHGARVVGYFFDVSTREAVARNQQRDAGSRVPDVAIFTTAKRLVTPSRDEGFDELYRVTLAAEGAPRITEM